MRWWGGVASEVVYALIGSVASVVAGWDFGAAGRIQGFFAALRMALPEGAGVERTPWWWLRLE
jgi:hypothetical protein